jgi:hypothetical protein
MDALLKSVKERAASMCHPPSSAPSFPFLPAAISYIDIQIYENMCLPYLTVLMSLKTLSSSNKNFTCRIRLSSTIAGAPKLCPISTKVGNPPVVKPCK